MSEELDSLIRADQWTMRTAVTRMQQSSSHRARILDDATASNARQAERFKQLRSGETVQRSNAHQ
jgi:hypothetical protein